MRSLRRLAFVMAALVVSACGQASLPGSTTRNMTGFAGLAASEGPLKAEFNNTYGERIAINEPKARKDPHNTDKTLLRLIRGAQESLDGAFYDIDDPGVVAELAQAEARGVRVRLVTDTDNMVAKHDPAKPREAIVTLQQAGVPIVDDKRSGIMHHKFMVVDGKTVWTGSTNLTPTSLYCHNNNALTIQSPELANAYSEEFERLFLKHEFGASTRQGLKAARPFQVGGASLQVFFSPRGGGREAVVNELRKAQTRIRFMTFSLTDLETGDTILERAQNGVKVEGIFDRWLAAGQYSLFQKFKGANLSVLKDGNEALMHHKVILIDNDTLITGSYNFSQNAEANNNEAFLIIKDAPELVASYSREFNRLSYAAKHNHPPSIKKPDDSEPKTVQGP